MAKKSTTKAAGRKAKAPKNTATLNPNEPGGKELAEAVAHAPAGKSTFLINLVGEALDICAQRDSMNDALKTLVNEAKKNGFSAKAVRSVIARQRKDAYEAEREEMEYATVKQALGISLTAQEQLLFDNEAEAKAEGPDPDAVARKRGGSSQGGMNTAQAALDALQNQDDKKPKCKGIDFSMPENGERAAAAEEKSKGINLALKGAGFANETRNVVDAGAFAGVH